jgi:ATP-dependent Clp protease adaptor protein ClpS
MSTETEVVIDEKIKKEVRPPKKFKVVFLNDDATPIDFVIELLMSIFHHSYETAQQLTLTIHTEGSGIAGVYSYEIAEQKGIEATNVSRNQGFPLQVKIEQE